MPNIRLLFLWHMHQPFYKDLVTSEYRLPWVRMHALKDYYGMVKLLDQFPNVHQTFNLVPSLIVQIEDYVAGTANDPFLKLASMPATDLTQEERRFALQYLFQANTVHMIARYPRYLELQQRFAGKRFNATEAERLFSTQDFTDLQVLSQVAWFDELLLEDREMRALIRKGRDFTRAQQEFVTAKQQEILAQVLPAYKSAAERGIIEISTSPFYHPILPLVCDTDTERVSSPGMPLPARRFRHPDDAAEQIRRGLDLHQQVFGIRPRGMWPSEGSVSDEAIALAASAGIEWMATDEGVLGRSVSAYFERDHEGVLNADGAAKLYRIHRYESGSTRMHMIFRDHSLSDLIGFVYSGAPAKDAAEDMLRRIRKSAAPILAAGRDAVVPIILDGENAWEYYPENGREFLKCLYDGIQRDEQMHAQSLGEAIKSTLADQMGVLKSVVPGSWINANFNVWIGAPEDNRSWDYLSAARDAYEQNAPSVSLEARQLAFEELLIAEGSDWNWWYGPEHHSANDREFDELYRKHLSNVYQALGLAAPEYLARPIAEFKRKVSFSEQTQYIHPRIDGRRTGYFDWMGAARYSADRSGSAMHGKEFLLQSAFAGIDEDYLYARLDFADEAFDADEKLVGAFDVAVTIQRENALGEAVSTTRVSIPVRDGALGEWTINEQAPKEARNRAAVGRVLELQLSLDDIDVRIGDTLKLAFSVWREKLPIDALPEEGAIAVRLVTEQEMSNVLQGEHWSA